MSDVKVSVSEAYPEHLFARRADRSVGTASRPGPCWPVPLVSRR
jgi:hypothetical protein